ncbi:MAG: PEP-utilizing enzyme, partial [Planctomycetes bacterium]|nr:PEP-utilizing enzyme [Planctomycetota bacterium]
AAQAILTERGGMTSHAALVARGWGKCCIVGCAELDIDAKRKTLKIGNRVFKSGDSLSLNGSTGNVYAGEFPTIPPKTDRKTLSTFLKMCDKLRTLKGRTNVETPADAALAREFGAEGIGLFRTEHMFYGGDPEALACLRRMILAGDKKAQQKAINQLFRFVKKDMKGTLQAMKGLPAGPGGAQGKILFTSEEAERVAKLDNHNVVQGEPGILVREETNPEDVKGMWASEAILTQRGGMTSHAALVARGWGKCCIVGCAELDIDAKRKTLKIGKRVFRSGDSLSLNGSTGNVYAGNFATIPPDTGGKTLSTFLKMCDKLRTLNVRTNAETPADASLACGFGAEGIGRFRPEHMFYG